MPKKHFLGGRSSDLVRKGVYKLVDFFGDQTVALYDVVSDVGEDNDLSSTMPEKVVELQRDLVAWRADVGVVAAPPYE